MHHSTVWIRSVLLGALTGCGVPQNRCEVDEDCSADLQCLTKETEDPAEKLCVASSCSQDTECGEEETCVLTVWNDGCGDRGAQQCSHADDACRSRDDCADGEVCRPATGDMPRSCQIEVTCAVGRPLSVQGRARVAPSTRGAGWGAVVEVLRPDGEASVHLAEHWTRVALMEHASVASFARFTLDLLALGAPASLVRDSQQASLDEIRHAELAFALATHFGGEPVGPGRLDLSGVISACDPLSFLSALIEEGCVGETVGATIAHADAEASEDPALAAILCEIAEDEARHSALAWRTLGWLMGAHPSLEAQVEEQLLIAARHLSERLAVSDPEASRLADEIAVRVIPACLSTLGIRRAA